MGVRPPLWRDPLFVIGIGVGLISVVSVNLLRDEYGTGAFVFALLESVPAGVFASGVVIGTPREYVRGRGQRTPKLRISRHVVSVRTN